MKTIIVTIFALLLPFSSWSAENAILEAKIHILLANAQETKIAKVQPGSQINLKAEVRNTGNRPSAPGSINIRFVLIEPFEDLLESRTFITETLPLPSIHPGQVAIVKFDKPHTWPSLTDYIRQNWNMRHYQAVIKINGDKADKIIGYLPVFTSAYYYEGPSQVNPQVVSIQNIKEEN